MLNESAPVEAAPNGNPQGLYEQRRRVELLRQQVYAQVDSGSSEALEEALLAAEAVLAEMEQDRQSQGSPPDQGLLYDSVRERGGPLQARMGRETTGVEASIFLRLSHVPTGIVHLLDPEEKPLVSVKITNPGRQIARLRVTSQVEEYSTTAVSTLELPPGDEKEIHQLPVFSIERLRQLREITRASLRVHIQHLSGTTEMERNFPIWLLARTTAYLEVRDPRSGSMIDLAPYLGAWVTPNAPEVMELLRRAVDLNPEGHIAGYQVDPEGVETQVKAIYYAVKEEKVQYVNSVFCFGREGGEFIQRIRLPRESLEHRSANCIDGTVLMASLLEAASLNPAIVLVPGHAFLAWETQEGSGNWDYLETTLIGSRDFEEARRVGRGLAQRYRASPPARGNRKMFRLLPVPALRVQGGILPME